MSFYFIEELLIISSACSDFLCHSIGYFRALTSLFLTSHGSEKEQRALNVPRTTVVAAAVNPGGDICGRDQLSPQPVSSCLLLIRSHPHPSPPHPSTPPCMELQWNVTSHGTVSAASRTPPLLSSFVHALRNLAEDMRHSCC